MPLLAEPRAPPPLVLCRSYASARPRSSVHARLSTSRGGPTASSHLCSTSSICCWTRPSSHQRTRCVCVWHCGYVRMHVCVMLYQANLKLEDKLCVCVCVCVRAHVCVCGCAGGTSEEVGHSQSLCAHHMHLPTGRGGLISALQHHVSAMFLHLVFLLQATMVCTNTCGISTVTHSHRPS